MPLLGGTNLPKVAAVTKRSIAKFANIMATRKLSEKRILMSRWTMLEAILKLSARTVKRRLRLLAVGSRTQCLIRGRLRRKQPNRRAWVSRGRFQAITPLLRYWQS